MKIFSKILILGFLSLYAVSCSDNNPQQSVLIQEQVYVHNGTLDSLVGTCSVYLIRTFPLDTLDFTGFERIRFERDSFTDGDLSGISLYYLNSEIAVNVINLEGIQAINNTSPVEIQSPKNRTKYFIRLKLNSSFCTGDLFRLVVRNPVIYGVK
jgi:hypothetical protein